MGAHRFPLGKNGQSKDPFSDLLDFGPETPEASPDLTERIRKVKEKIEEINQRIARLTTRAG